MKWLNSELHNLDLIDLLSEHHILLRRISEKLWNDNSDINISNSEWFIMQDLSKATNDFICIKTSRHFSASNS